MKNIFNYRFLIALLIISFAAVLIIFSIPRITLDPSIQSLFPRDENMNRSVGLCSLSPIADKVIVYIEVNDENNLKDVITQVQKIIEKHPIDFNNAIPDTNDIKELLEYSEKISLLLYPYELGKNPFTYKEMKNRIKNKTNYLMSLPFFNPSDTFFLDPLMMGTEILKSANENRKGKYSPQYGGVISSNKKAYIKILKSGFLPENYNLVKQLKNIDNEIVDLSKKLGCKAFLYSAHFFYLESKETIQREIFIIFIFTTFFVLLIFYFFFKKISLLFFSFMPIVGGFAITFLLIALFKKEYGGIALAFGATTSGIAIDYTIHYLTKRHIYLNLKETRGKIGFSLILGFITTLVSFIFLPFSQIKSLQEIAIFGILTISFAFFLSWFVLQRLVPSGKNINEIRRINFPIFYKKTFFMWLGVIIILMLFIPFIKFEENILNLDMKHKELNTRLKIIQSNFLESSDSIFLTFTGENKDAILEKSLSALQIIQKEAPDLSFFTPAIFYPPKSRIDMRIQFIKDNFNKKAFLRALNDSAFTYGSFNKWLGYIDEIIGNSPTPENNDVYSPVLPNFLQQEVESMFVKWHDKDYILIPLYTRIVSDKIRSILSKNNVDFYIVDVLKDSAAGLIAFEKNALVLLLLSIFVIFIILLIAYKDVLHAFCAVLPSIAALITCVVITVLTTRAFNIMHLVAAILLLGIGVDYGIFITGAFKNNHSIEEIQLTYQSIFISALTTLAGFGILTFSSNYSIFSLGSGMFVGIIAAFLTAYLALPYLIKKNT
ncbi:MAG: hypothetical protein KAT05_11975 [Spirochaetes bacterium]|nr:hypothetical protein [Spirochaetota bacterium]